MEDYETLRLSWWIRDIFLCQKYKITITDTGITQLSGEISDGLGCGRRLRYRAQWSSCQLGEGFCQKKNYYYGGIYYRSCMCMWTAALTGIHWCICYHRRCGVGRKQKWKGTPAPVCWWGPGHLLHAYRNRIAHSNINMANREEVTPTKPPAPSFWGAKHMSAVYVGRLCRGWKIAQISLIFPLTYL